MVKQQKQRKRKPGFLDWCLLTICYFETILLAGLVGALALGFLEHRVRQWGWLAMAVFAAVGVPLGWVKMGEPTSSHDADNNADPPTQWLQIRLGGKSTFYVGTPPKSMPPKQPGPKTVSIWQSCCILSFFGVIAGSVIGFLLVIALVSLALSPFTPDSWRTSFQVDFLGASSSSLLPFAIMGVAMAAGLAAGLVLGVVLSCCGRIWKQVAL